MILVSQFKGKRGSGQRIYQREVGMKKSINLELVDVSPMTWQLIRLRLDLPPPSINRVKCYVPQRLRYTLLPTTLCSLGKVCSLEHFTPQHILLPGTLCSLEHFAYQHSLLLSTLCFLKHSAPWNTLLPGILCSLEHLKQSVPESKVFQGAVCSWKPSVLRSKLFYETKCSQRAKCPGEQSVCQPLRHILEIHPVTKQSYFHY